MYPESDYLMLSGIQHYAFCRRQWALIHIEEQWEENLRTIEGELLHKKAHSIIPPEKRKGVIITRGMAVHSREMGVSGICDIVEFIRDDAGIPLAGHRGRFRILPVEYKRGKPKTDHSDILQVTAQALCLEEMLCCTISEGAIYYGEIRHREQVAITEELRGETKQMFADMHHMYESGHTPKVKRRKSCNACSLKEICLPEIEKTGSVHAYIRRHIAEE
jgi:CRISPR-associated exonuclease Cas4